jgi:hypothetical protein
VLSDELPSEVLASFREVVEIRTRVPHAGGAIAKWVEIAFRELVDASPELQKPTRGKCAAALRHLRRDDAVEHVHAAMNCLEDVQWCPDPHEISRTILR